MSIGRLLAAGKSLAGGQSGSGRYRLDKRASLPKFGSPKNPFVQQKSRVAAPPQPESVQPTATADRSVAKLGPPALKSSPSVATRLRQAARQLREWCADKNPIPRIAIPVRSMATPRDANSPVQSELTLDEVRVVRNDLSDADLEIVPAKPAMGAEVPPLPEENVWSRLTTRIFVRAEPD